MNKYFLTKNIEIEIIPTSNPFSETNFFFGSGGLFAAAGKFLTQDNGTINTLTSESIGSEGWYTEASDFFRFYDSGQLHSIILKVTEENLTFNSLIPQPQDGYFSMRLSTEKEFFIVPPQMYRCFNSSRRKLFCFTENTPPKTVLKITANLSLMFDNNNIFSGWIFHNPLENITAAFQGKKDLDEVDNNTYNIFSDYFEIISKNEAALHDDDFEIVVKKLLDKIDPPRISKIKGNIRREILTKTLLDLKENFLDS
ncbi:hypothetical protein F1735_33235 [Massilia sp. CCM 8694]|uniref:Uncharacterized protein n=2 Tax=Massilia genomosp. 1 TaxID=2609280 RepID=A0ABX0MWJ9_9BURK|nr:hypothetical protein [Massilia genomosp. 1]